MFVFNSLISQNDDFMGRCAMPDDIISIIDQNQNSLSCNSSFNTFIANHRNDMIPTGSSRTLKIKTNVIFMQDENGIWNNDDIRRLQ